MGLRNKRPSMHDVSALANVSKATVSRCVNAPHIVQPATFKRVVAAMNQIGYKGNPAKADAFPKTTLIVALMIPTIRSSLFAETTYGVEKIARANNHHVLIGNSQYSAENDRAFLELWLKLPLRGLILTGFFDSNRDLVHKFAGRGIPCVITYETLANDGVNYVGVDNFEASYRATEYLMSLGHRDIASILGPFSGIRRTRRRLDGYVAALSGGGLDRRDEYIIETEPTLRDGKEAAARLLSLDEPPTAIFCAGDALAMGAIAQIKDAGLKVPDDISVMGFDDIEFAAFCDPPLTTMKLPSYEMGQLAMKIFLDTDRTGTPHRQYRLKTDLVIRHSCAPPKNQQVLRHPALVG